jgi:hypothetical protein
MRSLIALVLVTGCGLYQQHNEDDCPSLEAPSQLFRDPFTGQCLSYTACDPCRGPCPIAPPGAPNAFGSGAACLGVCEKLSEAACLDSKACHAAYRTDTREVASFVGCWSTTLGEGGGGRECAQLDVTDCPYHNECATWYTGSSDADMTFDHCEAERESCEPGTCGAPPPCPSNSVPSTRDGCYTGRCIARSECAVSLCLDHTSEAQCSAFSQCEPLFQGDACTCTPDTCTCAKRTFESCRDRPL